MFVNTSFEVESKRFWQWCTTIRINGVLDYADFWNETKSVDFSLQANYTDWATDQQLLVPTFVDRRVLRGQCDEFPWPLISVLQTGAATFVKYLVKYPSKAEWTPFLTHCFSEKSVFQYSKN
jgi:hypothetical protein